MSACPLVMMMDRSVPLVRNLVVDGALTPIIVTLNLPRCHNYSETFVVKFLQKMMISLVHHDPQKNWIITFNYCSDFGITIRWTGMNPRRSHANSQVDRPFPIIIDRFAWWCV